MEPTIPIVQNLILPLAGDLFDWMRPFQHQPDFGEVAPTLLESHGHHPYSDSFWMATKPTILPTNHPKPSELLLAATVDGAVSGFPKLPVCSVSTISL